MDLQPRMRFVWFSGSRSERTNRFKENCSRMIVVTAASNFDTKESVSGRQMFVVTKLAASGTQQPVQPVVSDYLDAS